MPCFQLVDILLFFILFFEMVFVVSILFLFFILFFTFFISHLVSIAPRVPEEKRRLIIVSVFRLVFVVIFLQCMGCVCG